ncbi:hypothetical protein EV647_0570 [Kribbella sp. VKM Ac-2566]|nr:hypothetical protein EV647_0570 [Kribbella sp. VKM Ac-2566]
MRMACRVALMVSACSVALGLVGCSGSIDKLPQATQTTAARAASASTSPTAEVRLTTATFVQAVTKAMSTTGAVRTTLLLHVGGQTVTTSGLARFGDRPAMSVEMKGPAFHGTARLILVNGVLYVSVPGHVPVGKYLKIKAGDTSPMANSFRQTLDSMDPKKTFAALGAGLRAVTYVGSERKSGETLVHYKLLVDTKSIMAAQGQQMVDGLPQTIAYNVWLDSTRLMRKVTFNFAGVDALLSTSRYAGVVNIKAPSRNNVVN